MGSELEMYHRFLCALNNIYRKGADRYIDPKASNENAQKPSDVIVVSISTGSIDMFYSLISIFCTLYSIHRNFFPLFPD